MSMLSRLLIYITPWSIRALLSAVVLVFLIVGLCRRSKIGLIPLTALLVVLLGMDILTLVSPHILSYPMTLLRWGITTVLAVLIPFSRDSRPVSFVAAGGLIAAVAADVWLDLWQQTETLWMLSRLEWLTFLSRIFCLLVLLTGAAYCLLRGIGGDRVRTAPLRMTPDPVLGDIPAHKRLPGQALTPFFRELVTPTAEPEDVTELPAIRRNSAPLPPDITVEQLLGEEPEPVAAAAPAAAATAEPSAGSGAGADILHYKRQLDAGLLTPEEFARRVQNRMNGR